MVEGWEPNSDGYDALWKVKAPLQRVHGCFAPDSKAIPRSTENTLRLNEP